MRPNKLWRRRDWVIKAFNQNMSQDEFAIEQLDLDTHRFGFPYLGLNQRLIGPAEEAQWIQGIWRKPTFAPATNPARQPFSVHFVFHSRR